MRQQAAIKPAVLCSMILIYSGFGHVRIAIVVELKYFALRHFLAGFGEDFVDPLAAKFHDLTHGSGIEIISDQNTDLIAPNFSGGLVASADIGIIDDIIMQERGGMDEFHEAAELMVFGAGIPAESGAEEQKRGRIRLPPLLRMCAATVLTRATLESRFFSDLLFDALQLVTIGIPHIRHRVDRGG